MPRPPAAFVSDEELALSVPALVEEGRADLALRTLWLAADGAPGLDRFARLLDLLPSLPPETRGSGPGVRLHLRLLTGLRRAGDTLDAVQAARRSGLDAPFLNVYGAWALSQQERFGEALEGLAPALRESLDTAPEGQEAGGLTRFEDTLGWRVRARSLAALGRGGWREAYARARLHAPGRALALVWLEEGATLGGRGDVQGALRAYTQALPLVERDPYYHALALHNLGLVCLRACRFGEAEAYFGRVRGVGRAAAAFHARALCGEGAVRRALGEWDRAASAYRAALDLKAEDDDSQQAWRGLGHTLRLSGRARSALEWLTRAVSATPGDRQTGRSWVFVDVAATYAALGDIPAAHEALERTPPLAGEDADRERIVRAELARQGGDLAGALASLDGLDPRTLWAREEAHAFPELFALLPAPVRPAPLPRAERTRVTVRAIGSLDVRVNGRSVPVGPTSRAGVLLVALLEAGEREGTGELALAVSTREDRRERHGKQAVSRIAGELRRALGWEGSVQARSGAYFLDPEADWEYDVRAALDSGQRVEAFLSGVTLPWALDREKELRQRDSTSLI